MKLTRGRGRFLAVNQHVWLAVLFVTLQISQFFLVAPTVQAQTDPEATCTAYKNDPVGKEYIGSASYIAPSAWNNPQFRTVGNNLELGIEQKKLDSLFIGAVVGGAGKLKAGIKITATRKTSSGLKDITLLGQFNNSGDNIYKTVNPNSDEIGPDTTENRTLRDGAVYFIFIEATKSATGAEGPPESFKYCLSSATNSSETINKGTVSRWFNDHLNEISIDYKTATSPTAGAKNPPQFKIPANTAKQRPELTFKLFDASGGGGGAMFDTRFSYYKYWSFQGYKQGLVGVKDRIDDVKIPDLVFMVDSNDRTGDFYWMAGADIRNLLGTDELKQTHEIPTNLNAFGKSGGIDVAESNWRDLAAYSMVRPSEPLVDTGTDCQKDPAKFKSTGPGWKNDKTGTILEKVQPVDDPMGLNPSCLNKNPDPQKSWLTFWDVKQAQEVTTTDCGIDKILAGGLEIGKIFSKLTQCLFDAIFVPLVTWASGLVETAAGISYQPAIVRWRA